jgi:hypothetical protein
LFEIGFDLALNAGCAGKVHNEKAADDFSPAAFSLIFEVNSGIIN